MQNRNKIKNTPVTTFGLHAVAALLKNHPDDIRYLLLDESRHDKKIQFLVEEAKRQSIEVRQLSRDELDRVTQNTHHQGIAAVCEKIKNYSESDLEKILFENEKPFLLILDGVQDPHNLGACLRSADAAGVHAVIAPKDNSVGLTPVVFKVASGAAATVPFIQVTNLARTMKFLREKNIWIYGAAEEAEKNCYETQLTLPLAIALGAEGKGLRRLTREHCDVLIKIPMQGSVSSLNVSVATGILLFEIVRQITY